VWCAKIHLFLDNALSSMMRPSRPPVNVSGGTRATEPSPAARDDTIHVLRHRWDEIAPAEPRLIIDQLGQRLERHTALMRTNDPMQIAERGPLPAQVQVAQQAIHGSMGRGHRLALDRTVVNVPRAATAAVFLIGHCRVYIEP
jgi:hypothetical protein